MKAVAFSMTVPLALAACSATGTETGASAGCSQLELSLDIRPGQCGTYSLNELTRIKHERETDGNDD
jgi:hypothetical protein